MIDPVNPYASPMHEAPPPSSLRLFSPNQVLVGSFLAGGVAGAILVAINEARLGRGARAPWIVLLGIVAVVAAVGSTYVLPNAPAIAIAAGVAAGMHVLGRHLGGRALEEHMRRDERAGAGSVAGWSVLGLAIALLVAAGVIFIGDGPRSFLLESRAAIAPEQNVLFYEDTITRAEAQHLADGLHGALSDGPSDVQLDEIDGVYDLCFFIPDGAASEPGQLEAWRALVAEALPPIYPDGNVKAGLCEADGTRKAEVFP